MNWLSKLERKFGKYAVPNLMNYVLVFYAFGYAVFSMNPWIYVKYLSLNWNAVFHGQIWRLVTFLIQPPDYSLVMVVLAIYIYYTLARQLEAIFGTFRFNFYFISGVVIHILVSLVMFFLTGASISPSIEYLNLSLFLVFACLFPNAQFLLFFAVPISGKVLLIIDGIYFAWAILGPFLPGIGGRTAVGYSNALSAVAALLNFGLFYLLNKGGQGYSHQDAKRKREYKKKIKYAQQSAKTYEGGAKHKCAVCGRTELDDPNLEFRYCSKCKGNYEYCQEHLFTHIHVE